MEMPNSRHANKALDGGQRDRRKYSAGDDAEKRKSAIDRRSLFPRVVENAVAPISGGKDKKSKRNVNVELSPLSREEFFPEIVNDKPKDIFRRDQKFDNNPHSYKLEIDYYDTLINKLNDIKQSLADFVRNIDKGDVQDEVRILIQDVAHEANNLAVMVGSNISALSSIGPSVVPQASKGNIIEIKTFTRKEDDLSDPVRVAAIEKLLSFKDEIDYQRVTGRAAVSVEVWLYKTLVEPGRLSLDELALIPMWAYREFNQRLYQALHNKRRRSSEA